MAAVKDDDEPIFIVDVRPTQKEFLSGHCERAAWIPLALLRQGLLCALPPRDTQHPPRIAVVASSPADAADAAALIASAKYNVVSAAPAAPQMTSHAPAQRLWQPNAFLARFVSRIEEAVLRKEEEEERPLLCVDVGCGSGRDAVFLAARGWTVHALDSNDRLLGTLARFAAHEGVEARVFPRRCDVAAFLPQLRRQQQQFSLVHVARFLHRPSLEDGTLHALVHKGGCVLFHTFAVGCTKPRGARHLLRPGELQACFGPPLRPSWRVLECGEETLGDGRPVQFVLAQRIE